MTAEIMHHFYLVWESANQKEKEKGKSTLLKDKCRVKIFFLYKRSSTAGDEK